MKASNTLETGRGRMRLAMSARIRTRARFPGFNRYTVSSGISGTEALQYGYALRCASGRAGQLHAKGPCKLDRSLIEPRFWATLVASSCTTLFDGTGRRVPPLALPLCLGRGLHRLGRGPPAITLADRPVIPLQPQRASLFLGHECQ
jgi:hypothetical protein